MHDASASLIKMANQIAAAFRQKPEAEALASTATHIRKFWDPRMKAKIAEHVAHGGDGLTPLALAAVKEVCKPKTPAQ